MSDYPETLDSMLAAWNERVPVNVRGHLERALAPAVHFVDPTNDVVGIDAFEAMVHEFRRNFPDAVCSRASGLDSHHQLYRYNWESHRGAELMLQGFDVVETEPSGKVLKVLGFFGPLPTKVD
jgi:hypothetical protein